VDFHHIHELSVETVLDEARTLYDVWPKMEFEEKRKVVEALADKVVVGRGRNRDNPQGCNFF